MQEAADSLPRWLGPLFAAVALALLPWTFWLTQTLPAHHVSEHWREAWTGFDVALAAALTATAVGVARRTTWRQEAAAATATLLVADAWFDTLLSDHPHVAVTEAVLSELPLAALCLWVVVGSRRSSA